MFLVNQKVVCIKEGLWLWERLHSDYVKQYGIVHPRKGEILTVRSVEIDASGNECIRLFEILNPVGPVSDNLEPTECTFSAIRFRPLVEHKTDISIFTAMLTPCEVVRIPGVVIRVKVR